MLGFLISVFEFAICHSAPFVFSAWIWCQSSFASLAPFRGFFSCRSSDFEFRTSFGLRPSDFGFLYVFMVVRCVSFSGFHASRV